MIAGSGLRDGDANISTVSPYAQFNVGIAREFLLPDDSKPMTLPFDIINLFETVYQIRSGSGIGVFAAMRTAPRLPRHIEKDLKAQTRSLQTDGQAQCQRIFVDAN